MNVSENLACRCTTIRSWFGNRMYTRGERLKVGNYGNRFAVEPAGTTSKDKSKPPRVRCAQRAKLLISVNFARYRERVENGNVQRRL